MAALLVAVMATAVQAQDSYGTVLLNQQQFGPYQPPVQPPYQPPVQPPYQPPVQPPYQPPVQPPQAQRYYFGMTIGLVSAPGLGQVAEVFSVNPGGPAATAGLEVGDRIISVNGNRFTGYGVQGSQLSALLSSYVGGAAASQGTAVSYRTETVVGPDGRTTTRQVPYYTTLATNVGNPPVSLIVNNVRNRQAPSVQVTIYPQRQ